MAEENRDTVTLTVDGVEVTVSEGTTVIEAAEQVGVVVPHYCYHPGIPTRPAQCRVCLVEVEGQQKLQPSCILRAQDDMVVHTASDRSREARRSVIEFLLVNHPLDCPICDAAGQCMLQDYAWETGQLESRLRDEKLVMGRDKVAEDILYFADRCIICTRCVRFMREVARDDSLIVAQRGDRAYIDVFPGEELDNPFQGNIVDVCPVGALVHEDYLFKARSWDLDKSPGVCPGCSQGCNVHVDTKENQIVRLKPRYNGEVNSYWMCDYGRKHLVMGNRGIRAEVPLLRENGEFVPAGWSDALERLAGRLRELDGGGRAIVSPDAPNESLFFFRQILDRVGIEEGLFTVEQGEEHTLEGFPELKLREDRAANVSGAELFGFRRVEEHADPPAGEPLFVLGESLRDAPEGFGDEASFFLYAGSFLSPAARRADVILPVATFAEQEGTFTNFEGRVQRFMQALQPPGIARPGYMVLSGLLAQLTESGSPALSARAAFGLMTDDHPAMSGLDWERMGLKGQELREPATAQVGSQPPAGQEG